ncbi:MAG: hypothetical protein PVJ05_11285 [Candidatus Thorarchaeota archaeon]|jgi:hypothetical protein
MLAEPTDFVGKILSIMINKHLEDPSTLSKVKSWRMKVVLQTDYYPLSLIFDDSLRIENGVVSDPILVVSLTFERIIQLIKGKSSLIKSVLNRSIRIKGLLRHPVAAFRFYGFINAVLKG